MDAHPVMYKTSAHPPECPGVSVTVAQASGGRVFWAFDTTMPENSAKPKDLRAFMSSRLGHVSGENVTNVDEDILGVLASTEEKNVLRTDLYEADALPWTRIGHGNVILIGDAAHVMVHHFGQGACVAIEDAVRLAQLLDTELSKPTTRRTRAEPVPMRIGRAAVAAISEMDSFWKNRWRPYVLLLISRYCGWLYMENSRPVNTLIHYTFVWLAPLFVLVMKFLLFSCNSDLADWLDAL
jgi:2-polyprenyl-6-methoxyphenol hydroxylase-like FAD-dependent oxidoreductase